ncbi:hypothetical protein DSO57_1024760 [Entomophthora muscae]|uniref:Uncharacterized protein n=1 Tax=Entomophthora muscae TaxID=34485 RepID=A0ACC2RTE3_9FUNG|nr:hypothetical protein DSO57_1024760 [Entomophthora muscae]
MKAKKAKDWKCKLCGEKQSLKRIYFESSAAKDCRLQVQQLNLKRNRTPSPQPASEIPIPPVIINSDDSKWKKFKADQEEFQDIVDDDLFSNLEKLNSENKAPPKARNRVGPAKKSNSNFNPILTEGHNSKAKSWNNPSEKNAIFPSTGERTPNSRPLKSYSENHSREKLGALAPLKNTQYRKRIHSSNSAQPEKVTSTPQAIFSDTQAFTPATTELSHKTSKWASFNTVQPVQAKSKWDVFNNNQEDNEEDEEEGISIW